MNQLFVDLFAYMLIYHNETLKATWEELEHRLD